MKRLKEYFSNKTGEQIFALCLLVSVVAVMLFCAIVRLCGGLWFTADLESVPEPSKFWREVIKGALLIFELLFVYKILCRTSWLICFGIALAETLIGILLGETISNALVSGIYYGVCYFIIPLCFNRSWFSLLESFLLYILQIIYAVLFLYGRVGVIDISNGHNFIYSVLGSIDYKLFIVCLYLLIKYFGGFKLWKKQKRLIFQTDLKTSKKESEGQAVR